jgi:hypothetical protein
MTDTSGREADRKDKKAQNTNNTLTQPSKEANLQR